MWCRVSPLFTSHSKLRALLGAKQGGQAVGTRRIVCQARPTAGGSSYHVQGAWVTWTLCWLAGSVTVP